MLTTSTLHQNKPHKKQFPTTKSQKHVNLRNVQFIFV
jgi:hypothetical protein